MHVPEARDEAIRDLCRARTDAVRDQRRSRQQLKALLLRLGYHYTGKSSWNEAHLRYLRELKLTHPAQKTVLEEYLIAIGQTGERIARLSSQIEFHVSSWRFKPAVEALMAMRGIQLIAASVLISELGDLRRFAHPRQLMAYLGLVSSENSTGDSRHQGAITKCGNTHARWFLIEPRRHSGLCLAAQGEQRAKHTSATSFTTYQRTRLESANPAPPPLLGADAARALPAESCRGRGPGTKWIHLGPYAGGACT